MSTPILSAGLIKTETLSISGAQAGAIKATNLNFDNLSLGAGDLTVGGNLKLTNNSKNITFDVGLLAEQSGDNSMFNWGSTIPGMKLDLINDGIVRGSTSLLDWDAAQMDRTEVPYPDGFCGKWNIKIYSSRDNHVSVLGKTTNLGYVWAFLNLENETKTFAGGKSATVRKLPIWQNWVWNTRYSYKRVNVISDTEIIFYFVGSGFNPYIDGTSSDTNYMRLKLKEDGTLEGFTSSNYLQFNDNFSDFSYVTGTRPVELWEGHINITDVSGNGTILEYSTPIVYTGVNDSSGKLIVDLDLSGNSMFTWPEASYTPQPRSNNDIAHNPTLAEYQSNNDNFWKINDLGELCATSGTGWGICLKQPHFNYKLTLDIRIKAGSQMTFNVVDSSGVLITQGHQPEYYNSGLYQRGRYEMQLTSQDENNSPGSTTTDLPMSPIYESGPIYPYGYIPHAQFVAPFPFTPETYPYNTTGDASGVITGYTDASGHVVNHYELWVVGRTFTFRLNDVVIFEDQQFQHPTGGALDAEEDYCGLLYIQGDHAPGEGDNGMFFSNITVTPITNSEFMLNANNTIHG